MTTTTNYNLKKPDYSDAADIAVVNENMDTIDSIMAGKQSISDIDSTPTSGSNNPVASGGVYNDLANKADKSNTVLNNTLSAGRKYGTVVGSQSFAFGYNVTASGSFGAHAEGDDTTASGNFGCHAEGDDTTASGNFGSHSEGCSTTASGNQGSHAEGDSTQASGLSGSHAEGYQSVASGKYGSHAEGHASTASGDTAHAEGSHTLASSEGQHVQGRFNEEDANDTYAHIVGNGTSDSDRSNAHTLDWSGNAEFAGDVIANGCGGSSPISLAGLSSSLTNKTDYYGTVDASNYNFDSTDGAQAVLSALPNNWIGVCKALYSYNNLGACYVNKASSNYASMLVIPDNGSIKPVYFVKQAGTWEAKELAFDSDIATQNISTSVTSVTNITTKVLLKTANTFYLALNISSGVDGFVKVATLSDSSIAPYVPTPLVIAVGTAGDSTKLISGYITGTDIYIRTPSATSGLIYATATWQVY